MGETKHRTLTDALKAEMLSNKYVASRAIPSETQLSRKFKVSRTTVRKALDGLLDDRKALRTMRREMHGFYSTLKNNVGIIRFLMMTGVSKFTKLSVFSGLNNLTDEPLMESL